MRGRILIIDDDLDICELLAEALQRLGYAVTSRREANEAIELLMQEDFDVAVVDMNLAGASGLDVCRHARQNRPSMPVILITGFGDMDAAIAAIRAGAQDFINKPLELPLLEHAIERARKDRQLREQINRLEQAQVPAPASLGALVGRSLAMRGVYDLVRRVAATDTTILLSGESGTGKELVARALHEQSGRGQGPFVGINCAAMPSELLESELFGHVRGAFTDAKASRQGLFEQASSGTLLLDEIGEMPLDTQPKLLRVLQERMVRPVGGNGSVPVTARIIAATNRDLEAEVEAKRFREDLFYRLNVVQIHVPPLRARGNDVLLLAEHFVREFAQRTGKPLLGVEPEAQRKLLAYDWPGNVRQLENCIERAVALSTGERLRPEDLPERVVSFAPGTSSVDDLDLEHVLTLDQLERRQIERAIRQQHGNKTRAAKQLGIDRRTLYRKLERYDGAEPLPRPPLAQQNGRSPSRALS